MCVSLYTCLFAADGVTPIESRLDVFNSDIGYLGSHSEEAYELSWKALGIGPEVHAQPHVYGDVANNHINDNVFGVYTYGAFGMHIFNNEVDHDTWYSIDPHDDSGYLDIENNYTHDNGTHGIILSRRHSWLIICIGIYICNAGHGIMRHRSSNDTLGEGNTASSSTQQLDYTIGTSQAGQAYRILKNGIVLATITADSQGFVRFSDVTGTTDPVSYTLGLV